MDRELIARLRSLGVADRKIAMFMGCSYNSLRMRFSADRRLGIHYPSRVAPEPLRAAVPRAFLAAALTGERLSPDVVAFMVGEQETTTEMLDLAEKLIQRRLTSRADIGWLLDLLQPRRATRSREKLAA